MGIRGEDEGGARGGRGGGGRNAVEIEEEFWLMIVRNGYEKGD